MKKNKLFYLIIILSATFLTPTFSQVTLTVHPRELITYEKSYVYKNVRNKLYNETMEKIKTAKQDVAEIRTRLTLIHNYIYKSMTTVNGAIKQAKALKYSAGRLVHIMHDLDSLQKIARKTYSSYYTKGVEMVGPNGEISWSEMTVINYVFLNLALEYTGLIEKRIKKLEAYISEFILRQTRGGIVGGGLIQIGGAAPNIISNVVREDFLMSVYTELYIIDVQLHSFLYKATNVHVQTEVRKLNPFADFINQDKIMINTIKQDLKL